MASYCPLWYWRKAQGRVAMVQTSRPIHWHRIATRRRGSARYPDPKKYEGGHITVIHRNSNPLPMRSSGFASQTMTQQWNGAPIYTCLLAMATRYFSASRKAVEMLISGLKRYAHQNDGIALKRHVLALPSVVWYWHARV